MKSSPLWWPVEVVLTDVSFDGRLEIFYLFVTFGFSSFFLPPPLTTSCFGYLIFLLFSARLLFGNSAEVGFPLTWFGFRGLHLCPSQPLPSATVFSLPSHHLFLSLLRSLHPLSASQVSAGLNVRGERVLGSEFGEGVTVVQFDRQLEVAKLSPLASQIGNKISTRKISSVSTCLTAPHLLPPPPQLFIQCDAVDFV